MFRGGGDETATSGLIGRHTRLSGKEEWGGGGGEGLTLTEKKIPGAKHVGGEDERLTTYRTQRFQVIKPGRARRKWWREGCVFWQKGHAEKWGTQLTCKTETLTSANDNKEKKRKGRGGGWGWMGGPRFLLGN